MDFYPNQLFHIYNQGNNQQPLFFDDDNYRFFLWKMRGYLRPFGDLVAWCLMPNHFHWQFFVKRVAVVRKEFWESVDQHEYLRRQQKYGRRARKVGPSAARVSKADSLISLNDAIGMLQKSYARAIHKQQNASGSLFRKPCKAKDGWLDEFVTLKQPSGREDLRFLPGTDYAYQCFCYIHNNPVKAGLATTDVEWVYSSARDYAGLRKGSLCNLEMGRQLVKYV